MLNIEIHMLQNFGPSNLNRSETGAPKDCEFGGFRRARVSSQSSKRAIRQDFLQNFQGDAKSNLALRSSLLAEEIIGFLTAAGKDKDEATGVTIAALGAMNLRIEATEESDVMTEYLLFLGIQEVENVARVCLENYDALLSIVPADTTGMTAKEAKKAAKGAVPAHLATALRKVLDGGKAIDLALFGRMMADIPDKSRPSAAQMSHWLSTHATQTEFDFFTASDDLKASNLQGGRMLGTVDFNSACYYRYANIDVDLLKENLQGDEALARMGVEAFVRSMIKAFPSGKQNGMTSYETPSFVMLVVSDNPRCTLANAFSNPVKATERRGLIEASVEAFTAHYGRLTKVFGDNSHMRSLVTIVDADLHSLTGDQAPDAETMISKTLSAVFGS